MRESIQVAVISTDPPYYDNVGYADISDFFYVWMRHKPLETSGLDEFSTLLTPKAEELIADPGRTRAGSIGKAKSTTLSRVWPSSWLRHSRQQRERI